MKKGRITRGMILFIGIALTYSVMLKPELQAMSVSYYDSSINMLDTHDDIKDYLKNRYSSSSSSSYVGTATVSTTYTSKARAVRNISQASMNSNWNKKNPSKSVSGSCGYVALTMLIRDYMRVEGLSTDTEYNVFSYMLNYGFEQEYTTEVNKKGYKYSAGTTNGERKNIVAYYLKNKQDNEYTPNADTLLMWTKIKDSLNNKQDPIVLGLDGIDGGHVVVGTQCYEDKVTYVQKNVFGVKTNKTATYKVIRVCNGWENSESGNWHDTTSNYIFFDCVDSMLRLQ